MLYIKKGRTVNILAKWLLHNGPTPYYNSRIVYRYVWTLTPSKPLEESSQNFQGLIRAPHARLPEGLAQIGLKPELEF